MRNNHGTKTCLKRMAFSPIKGDDKRIETPKGTYMLELGDIKTTIVEPILSGSRRTSRAE